MPSRAVNNKIKKFNPVLIISQITFVLSINFMIMIFFTILFNSFFGLNLHVDQILSDKAFDFSCSYGYAAIFTLFFTSLFMTVVYVLFIEKANQILDYVLTNFFCYFIFTCLNSSFPVNFFWWLFNGAAVVATTLIAEYVSLRLEQKDIKLDYNFQLKKV